MTAVRSLPALLLPLAGLAACAGTPDPRMHQIATARVAEDFDTYDIRRVGMMPFAGVDLGVDGNAALAESFFTELSRATPFELVRLGHDDLEEIRHSEPHRRGWYSPRTIIDLARRYRLDAILFGTVTQQQFYPPQRLSVTMDMVSAETGLVIWSASVHLDAKDPMVRESLHAYFGAEDLEGREALDWQLSLLSPARFAQFAAHQVARLM